MSESRRDSILKSKGKRKLSFHTALITKQKQEEQKVANHSTVVNYVFRVTSIVYK